VKNLETEKVCWGSSVILLDAGYSAPGRFAGLSSKSIAKLVLTIRPEDMHASKRLGYLKEELLCHVEARYTGRLVKQR
jgi:hypothetical protein